MGTVIIPRVKQEERMEMKFRTLSGAIVSHGPMAQATVRSGLADSAAERGVGQVETAHLLRKQIESVIREYGADAAEAALAICVILDGNLDLANEGYFDGDETVLKVLMAVEEGDT